MLTVISMFSPCTQWVFGPLSPVTPPPVILTPPPVPPVHPPLNMAAHNTFRMPMANAREAPRFLSDHTGFDNFFRDVEELGRRAGISEVEKIDWHWGRIPIY